MTNQEMMDRLELRELVDIFANLADEKDAKKSGRFIFRRWKAGVPDGIRWRDQQYCGKRGTCRSTQQPSTCGISTYPRRRPAMTAGSTSRRSRAERHGKIAAAGKGGSQ